MSIQEFRSELNRRSHPSAVVTALRRLTDVDDPRAAVPAGDQAMLWPAWSGSNPD